MSKCTVQINGHIVRWIEGSSDNDTQIARARSAAECLLEGAEIVKTISLPNRLVNFVIRRDS